MSSTEGKPEYTPKSGRLWTQLLEASAELDRVLAEHIPRVGKVGADDEDVVLAADILQARGVAAVADALQSIRQELTLANNRLLKLSQRAT